MSPSKDRFVLESLGVKHVTRAIVQQLKNNSDLQSHLYAVPTATEQWTGGLYTEFKKAKLFAFKTAKIKPPEFKVTCACSLFGDPIKKPCVLDWNQKKTQTESD